MIDDKRLAEIRDNSDHTLSWTGPTYAELLELVECYEANRILYTTQDRSAYQAALTGLYRMFGATNG